MRLVLRLCVVYCVLCSLATSQWLEKTIEIPGMNSPCVVAYDSAADAAYAGGDGYYLTLLDGTSGKGLGFVRTGHNPKALCYVPPVRRMYAANDASGSITVIDGVTREVVATIPTGETPAALCYGASSGRLYCTNFRSGSITVVDVVTDSVVATVSVGDEPRTMCYNPATNKLYCGHWYGEEVTVVDCTADTALRVVRVGFWPVALCYNPTDNRVYCALEESDTVVVIDGSSDSMVATVPAGEHPRALCYEPTRNRVYCANNQSGTVTVIDGATNAVVATIDVGEEPVALTYNPANGRVYCANYADGSVSVIDPAANTVVATLSVGEGTSAIGLNSTGTRLYCANVESSDIVTFDCGDNSRVASLAAGVGVTAVCYDSADDKIFCATVGGVMSVITGDSASLTASVFVGAGVEDICWNQVSGKVYTANGTGGSVTVADATGDSVLATVTVGADPRALCYSPGMNRVYCASFGGNSVAVIDGVTNSLMATVPVGRSPISLWFNPTRNRIYSANLGGNSVTVIDGATNSVVATVPAGSYPYDLCYNPANDRVYCANVNGNSVTAIDCGTNNVVATVPVGSSPWDLAYCPANNCIYCSCFGSGQVWVIDGSTSVTVDTVDAGRWCGEMCYLPTSNRMYVANEDGAYLHAIHCAVNQSFWWTDVGEYPVDLAWDPVHRRVYTADYASGTVSVVRDAPLDVGVTRILIPVFLGEYELDEVVHPLAVGRNLGNGPANYRVWMFLSDSSGSRVYSHFVDVFGHPPGLDSMIAGFPECTLATAGFWLARCSMYMVGDSVPGNDALSQYFRVFAPDVGAAAVLAPLGPLDTCSEVTPVGRWRNYHGRAVSFTAYMMLEIPAGARVYCESLAVAGLALYRETTLVFLPFLVDRTEGDWRARCSTSVLGDGDNRNDTVSRRFRVAAGSQPPPPSGWAELAQVPLAPSGKAVKDGGWLAYMDGDGLVYAAKGNKAGDFYCYDPLMDTWAQRQQIPFGREGKAPGKGAAATNDGDRYIYATKGNNTVGFYRYDIEYNAWRQLSDVPIGPHRRKVKGGTDLVWVEGDERCYVYLLKGYLNEFYRYDVDLNVWSAMPDAPVGVKAKWDKGSWLAYDDDLTIYAHKAKYHELWAYDVESDSWVSQLTGMPFAGRSGRRKKSKEGGCAVWDDDIYALKGGNTQEFWVYLIDRNEWIELETLPACGSTGKRKKVKAGADITTDYGGVLFALKGNKTREFWRYVSYSMDAGRPSRDGVEATEAQFGSGDWGLEISPNPLRPGTGSMRYCLPPLAGSRAPVLTVYDATGRLRFSQTLAAGRTGSVDLNRTPMAAGVYLAELRAGGFCATRRFVFLH